MHAQFAKYSPLTEASYYILLSLLNPLHGYGVMKKVEAMSGGRVKLAAGTLYGAFQSLLSHQLIQGIGEDTANRRRKLYQVTPLGKSLILYEIERLQEMVANGRSEIGGAQ